MPEGIEAVVVDAKPVLHNRARVIGADPLTIETAPAQWAYAAHFPVAVPEPFDDALEIVVDVIVAQGEVGLGLLTLDERQFHVERQIAVDDGRATVRLTLDRGERSNKLVVRNVGSSGRPAIVSIFGARARRGGADAPSAVPAIHLSSAIFDRFHTFEGHVPAGFWVNWLGVRTRAGVWPFPPDVRAIYERDRHERGRVPTGDEHVLDWVPLLEAVVAARGMFRMVALGAGWGRWLTAGAFAARQQGLAFHLTGVEAEPEHFAWMGQHFDDNAIPPGSYRLIHAAASSSTDPCWFPVAKPDWYGQSIVAAPAAVLPAEQTELTVEGTLVRRVPSVTIEEVLTDRDVVDYLHMDIQGTEFDFLARDPERLNRLVRMVNIGTHFSSTLGS